MRLFLMLVSVMLITPNRLALAVDLRVELKFEKTHFRIGDTIQFRIIYTNTSKQTIRFLPDPERYSADVLDFKQTVGGRHGVVIPFGEMAMDFRALSDDVVVLRPGKSHSRPFAVRVSSTLPPSYDEKRRGIFLWFRGSNIELPDFGAYDVVTKYICDQHHPVARYVSGEPRLWHGVVESAAIAVTVEKDKSVK